MLVPLLLLLHVSLYSSLPAFSNKRTQLESSAQVSHLTAATLARWFEVRRTTSTELTQIVIAIKQSSPERLEELFWSVSEPSSPRYGQFLQQDELAEIVTPTPDSLDVVTSWLNKNGVDTRNCSFTPLKEFLMCELTVGQTESLLEVELLVYRNEDENLGEIMRSTTPLSVETQVKPHIDFIGGVNHFHDGRYVYSKISSIFTKEGFCASSFNATPAYVRDLYNVTGSGQAYLNKQAIVEFLGESISPVDLVTFMDTYGRYFTHYNGVDGIMGRNTPVNPGLTANLDVQYIMSLGNNIPTWVWSTEGKWHNIEPFLSWIVNVTSMQNRDLPLLFSCGYAEQEAIFSQEYLDRVNQEFMKIGLRGVTLITTSGDYGAGCQRSRFSPYFPASSPYVTSVGSTQLQHNRETAFSLSGGGFSDRFRAPSYQQEAVSRYLKSGSLPNQDYFNSRGRAIPDLSALGDNFVVRISGVWEYRVFSTSAATVTIAGIISLLNDKRLMKGDKQFGFLNPLLYQHPEVFRDIEQGHNTGCFGRAFSAREGWDPVTGLGVPLFIKMTDKLV